MRGGGGGEREGGGYIGREEGRGGGRWVKGGGWVGEGGRERQWTSKIAMFVSQSGGRCGSNSVCFRTTWPGSRGIYIRKMHLHIVQLR